MVIKVNATPFQLASIRFELSPCLFIAVLCLCWRKAEGALFEHIVFKGKLLNVCCFVWSIDLFHNYIQFEERDAIPCATRNLLNIYLICQNTNAKIFCALLREIHALRFRSTRYWGKWCFWKYFKRIDVILKLVYWFTFSLHITISCYCLEGHPQLWVTLVIIL